MAYITECDEAIEHARRIASRCAADLIVHDDEGHIREVVRRAELDAPRLVERERSGRVRIDPEEATQPHTRAGEDRREDPPTGDGPESDGLLLRI